MEQSKLLKNIRITIEQNPSYFAAVKNDKVLNKNKGVNELLDIIKQEAKTRAETAINDAENIFIRTPKIIDEAQKAFQKLRNSSVLKANFKYKESNEKYEHARQLIEDAIIKVESGEFEAILKAKSVAEEAKTTIIESHRLFDSAISIAINEEKQTIDGETRAKAAEVERLRLKKIQDENAIIAEKAAELERLRLQGIKDKNAIIASKAAARAAEEVRSRKVRAAMAASPSIIIRNLISGFIWGIFCLIIGAVVLKQFGYNNSNSPISFVTLLLICAIIGIGFGLRRSNNEIKEKLK